MIPAYLRAVDASVVQLAGKNSPGLAERGLALLDQKELGAAQMLADAAHAEQVPHLERLNSAIAVVSSAHPRWQVWGGGDYHLEILFGTDPGLPKTGTEPFTDWLVRLENRGTVLQLLEASSRPAVQELLRCRSLTNTSVFSPSQSASGQAFDAAVSGCGLLLQERKLTPALSNAVFAAAGQALRGGSTLPLEQLLMDFLSLGRRLNWSQLSTLTSRVQEPETLRLLTQLARQADGRMPVLFSAVTVSGAPDQVVHYLMTFGRTGLGDLGAALRYGSGGLQELLRRGERLHPDAGTPLLAVALSWHQPQAALALKWFLYLAGGFFLALALHFIWRVTPLEQPLQVRGVHLAREFLFALGLLVVVLLVTEPFLAQESQKIDFPFRLRLPTVVHNLAGPAGGNLKATIMNEKSLMTLLLFFVLQGLLYTASLVKLAEIRRQRVAPRVKLRLLENEDHLFDAGLYLGFVGTIISLILFSLGVIKPSLMAAYSSTSFGIIFVSIFKIFHLRPARRKVLLEAEAGVPETLPPTGALAQSA